LELPQDDKVVPKGDPSSSEFLRMTEKGKSAFAKIPKGSRGGEIKPRSFDKASLRLLQAGFFVKLDGSCYKNRQI